MRKDWGVRDRRCVEDLAPGTLRQLLADVSATPDIQVSSLYQPQREAALVVLHRPTPLMRSKTNVWHASVAPNLPFGLWCFAGDQPRIQSAERRVDVSLPKLARPLPAVPLPAAIRTQLALVTSTADGTEQAPLPVWDAATTTLLAARAAGLKAQADALMAAPTFSWDEVGTFNDTTQFVYPNVRLMCGLLLETSV